jgi:hypothetical protein
MVALAACDSSPEERISALCTTACRCFVPPVPGAQQECVGECIDDLRGANISEECTNCITGHANMCATIEIDCEPICDFDGGEDDPPPPVELIDAGVSSFD